MRRAQPRNDGLDQVCCCPFCRAPRYGESLIRHCHAKHQHQVPFVITVTEPAELIRASQLLAAHGFEVTYPPPGLEGRLAGPMKVRPAGRSKPA
jgi:hypothetical protein